MDDVKKALEAAGEAAREQLRASGSCLSEACDIGPCDCANDAAAAAIAAFLRALPVGLRGVPGAITDGYAPAVMPHLLAAAVEAAAKGDATP